MTEHDNKPFGYDVRIPEEIRDIFIHLCQDVVMLHHKVKMYRELFGTQENVNLLYDTARAAFNVIEESLANDILMSICRLSDPAKTQKSENLSFQLLNEKCAPLLDISEQVRLFVLACKPVIHERNKAIGHNDLNTRLRPRDNPLPNIDRQDIENILELAVNILEIVNEHYTDVQLGFLPFSIGDASDLIFWLREGQEYEEKKRNAWQ